MVLILSCLCHLFTFSDGFLHSKNLVVSDILLSTSSPIQLWLLKSYLDFWYFLLNRSGFFLFYLQDINVLCYFILIYLNHVDVSVHYFTFYHLGNHVGLTSSFSILLDCVFFGWLYITYAPLADCIHMTSGFSFLSYVLLL